MKLKAILFASAALVLATGTQAMAASNIVTNGDFATNDLTGFSQFGDTTYDGVSGGIGYFGAIGSLSGINQTLSTVAGAQYLFSFDLGNSGSGFDTFAISYNGTPVFFGTNVGYFGLTNYSFNVTGTGSDVISFAFQNDPDYYSLDNISVSAVAGAVPEPATWAMMLAGFGMIGFAARRRSSVKTTVSYA